MLDAAESLNVVERKGSYYYREGKKLGQGREKTLQYLEENPEDMEDIERATRAAMNATSAPDEIKTETEEMGEEEIDDESVVAAA